ncbi:hypothetical protein [uncultured Microbacterium sp.]|uniref:hypothetical protein n=1 Tax=uncultured Microbacterium sp. TaxID=191216 RepID=UPI0028EAF0DC|nr:hypothetical protein [uncultured Microbacterium sp.]
MGFSIFGRNIEQVYAKRAATELLTPPAKPPVSIVSPWSPQDNIVTWAVDDALGGLLDRSVLPLTREIALRLPGVKRAHGIICRQLASIPFFQMDNDARTDEQPEWLTSSQSGVAPYHRMYGAASDWFFNGWAAFGFTADMTDCLHIPFGLWKINEHGIIEITDERVPAEYTDKIIAIPLGYGENGLLVDGADTIRQARNVEAVYQQRLENPIPLTTLEVDGAVYDQWDDPEIDEFLDQWIRNRTKHATAVHPSYVKVGMPGQVQVDLYETGRNAARLDIANHTALPASILEAVRQGGGGGGTEMRYQGVANGGARSDLWDFGLARGMMLAFEARMSLDDVCDEGLSIRGDLTAQNAIPAPNTNPTSED